MRFYGTLASRNGNGSRDLSVSCQYLFGKLSIGLLYWAGIAGAVANSADWNCRPAADGDAWVCDAASAGAAQFAAVSAEADAPVGEEPPETPTSDSAKLGDEPPAIRPQEPLTEDGAARSIPTEYDYGTWSLCPPMPRRDVTFSDGPADDGKITTELTGLSATIYQEQIYELEGEAVAQHGNQRIAADHLIYDAEAGTLDARGHVQLDEPDYALSGSRARLLIGQDRGELYDVEYQAFEKHARGTAEVASQKNKNLRRFKKATYTTCPPGKNAWQLNARKVILEQDTGVGTAKHVYVELKDIPVFYSPYISFPIDDRRKSGFLVPSYGQSQESGTELRVPYYWNIAPNRDATITPRYLSRRGLQMIGEFRYLTPRHEGQIDVEYLRHDEELDDRNRALYSIDHVGRLAPRLGISAKAKHVSDKTYFDDLGNSLNVTSATHLEQRADATYAGDGWFVQTLVQNFQTIDETIPSADRPYKRLPQLLFQLHPKTAPLGTEMELRAETVRFDQNGRLTGSRVDLKPEISRPFTGTAYFVTPRLGLRYTTYNLHDTAPDEPSSPSRTIPIASLDSGLFFDRNLTLASSRMVHTLEPRLYYLYVPEKNQDDLPVFDTAKFDFNFQQMFRDNRFSGADRQGDSNQLTLALTSRLFDPASGVERIAGSIGSIVYFRNRDVVLPGETPETDSTSNLVGGLRVNPGAAWQMGGGLQWDPQTTRVDRASVNLRYWPDRGHLANLSYQYRRGVLQQIDISSLWYITPSWHGIFRWYHSLRDEKLLEGLIGVEYENCCWAFRTVVRNFINDSGGDSTTLLLFQLELKGLTSVGHAIDDLLEDEILGYGEAPW
jgi:LPS-assembly protein